MSAPELVRLTVADGIGTIRLDRPKVNVLNVQLMTELREAAAAVAEDDAARAVVLYGGQRAFAAGVDITEMKDLTYPEMLKRSGWMQDVFKEVARIPKPVVAAVTGYALGGGCELALCADHRIAADDAQLGQPEVLLGVIPGAGGTQRLTRLIGTSRAKDLIYTGRFVKADEALTLGLVDRVVPAASVYDEACAWAAQFARGPALALRAAKVAIDRGIETDLDTGIEIERQEFAALFATEDRATGMRSFITNGPGRASFSGR
ncbi:enoyl-CoA hydratase/isomerase family protein [Phytohabitans suffuscus]|uniref:enoyl-CoA hydratase n=1 Tax=Phytohabitans suffuscus TaxID=624315 RepID=A0A6F8YR98_9ACTN|nr:enoyl-CoA hydratase-related protein [Phytohabitans suffuscus]BCB88622.1 enoyl-CoA hydratase [Phytohabitans suffuscus]